MMLDLDPIRKRAEGEGYEPLNTGLFGKRYHQMKEDIPLLIAEVERLREEMEEIRNLEGQEGMTDSRAIEIALKIANKSQ